MFFNIEDYQRGFYKVFSVEDLCCWIRKRCLSIAFLKDKTKQKHISHWKLFILSSEYTVFAGKVGGGENVSRCCLCISEWYLQCIWEFIHCLETPPLYNQTSFGLNLWHNCSFKTDIYPSLNLLYISYWNRYECRFSLVYDKKNIYFKVGDLQ